ncbi:MAG: dolichol-phosphate mannosyltransferase [Pseudonocardiales bacterium]|nr:MAG: dolichol-phosphate mannosyltransferase [Pseudonocardiales bacterium]
MSASQPRVLVIIPTYDERENIEQIVGRTLEAVPEAHVLVVDDASPDGTGKMADKLAAADERIHVLHRSAKAGLGAAYIAGFSWGLANGFDVLVEMDADGSHAPEELPRLLTALRDADLVLGSRWVEGGQVRNWPRSRLLLSRTANTYARTSLRLPLRDSTAGYRAYRRRVLDALPLDEVSSQGYCFQIELAWRTWLAGFEVAEVPITFTEREQGHSKMSRQIVVEALHRVTYWGLRSRLRGVRRQDLIAR